jgi:hypothetical protein
LAQSNEEGRTKKRGLNNKVKRLEAMIEIRRLVVDGHSYDDIQQALGLTKRTFYRYLKRVFEDDKRILEQQNHTEVMRQVVILHDRYNKILKYIEAIATNEKVRAYDRLHALFAMKGLSDAIARLYRDAPALSIVQKRKLEAMKTGSLFFEAEKARLLPVYNDWSPYGNNLPPSPSSEEEEEEEEEEEKNKEK